MNLFKQRTKPFSACFKGKLAVLWLFKVTILNCSNLLIIAGSLTPLWSAAAGALAESLQRPWRRVCALAWPLAGADLLAFSKELIVTSYVGHMGPAQLSALVLGQAVYNISGAAPVLGVVAAMETFAGQAYGAGALPIVGEVLQRGLAISFLCCCAVTLLWQWCAPVLIATGQDPGIAAAAAQFTRALAPALFTDAADQCCRRYLGAQSIVRPALWITAVATLTTPLYLHLFCKWLGWGLLGAAAAWNAAQVTSLLLMVACCIHHACTGKPSRCTWPGWTVTALQGWVTYMKVAVPSCIMLCCEWWIMEVVVLLSGLLPNPHQTMSMMGITINLHAVAFLAAQGLGGAASTCVAQDLGAGLPLRAVHNMKVATMLGTLLMCASSLLLLICKDHIGKLFSSDAAVVQLTTSAVLPLALSLIGEGANTVLAGVMRGCGRQQLGAAVSLITYWACGMPLAYVLAFKLDLGAVGLWIGLTGTAAVQALLNGAIVYRLDWKEEAAKAKALVAAGELVLQHEQHVLLPKHSSNDSDTVQPAAAGEALPDGALRADRRHNAGSEDAWLTKQSMLSSDAGADCTTLIHDRTFHLYKRLYHSKYV